jgi:hypothetical protein
MFIIMVRDLYILSDFWIIYEVFINLTCKGLLGKQTDKQAWLMPSVNPCLIWRCMRTRVSLTRRLQLFLSRLRIKQAVFVRKQYGAGDALRDRCLSCHLNHWSWLRRGANVIGQHTTTNTMQYRAYCMIVYLWHGLASHGPTMHLYVKLY